jgi:5-methylcytosine-specific restriction endonuclease McrA
VTDVWVDCESCGRTEGDWYKVLRGATYDHDIYLCPRCHTSLQDALEIARTFALVTWDVATEEDTP